MKIHWMWLYASYDVITMLGIAVISLILPTSSQIYESYDIDIRGHDSSVGTSTTLRAGRSWDRIPVGSRFSAPIQTGPGAYPASCTMGTGSFPGVKRLGRGAEHPPPSKYRGHETVGLYLYSPSGPLWPVMGEPLPLPFSYEIDIC